MSAQRIIFSLVAALALTGAGHYEDVVREDCAKRNVDGDKCRCALDALKEHLGPDYAEFIEINAYRITGEIEKYQARLRQFLDDMDAQRRDEFNRRLEAGDAAAGERCGLPG